MQVSSIKIKSLLLSEGEEFLKNNSDRKKTRLRVNLRPRVDIFKMKLRPCQDHVCQDHVCQDHVCQDHVCLDHVCQVHVCQEHVC